MVLKVCLNFNLKFYSSHLLPPFFYCGMHARIHVCIAFPNSHQRTYRVAILYDICITEKNKRTDEQVARGLMLRNFWQTFYGKMKSVRLSLASAVVKASLLLRCGDVETNPGPVGKIKSK